MKRVWWGSVILALSAVLLAGCGGSGGSDAAEEQAVQEERTEPSAEGEEAAESSDAVEEAQPEQAAGEEKPKSQRPEAFPAEAVEVMSDHVATGEPKLSKEVVGNLRTVYERAEEFEDAGEEELDAILQECGFETRDGFIEANTSALMATDALNALNGIQQIIDSSSEEQKAAESFELSDAMRSFAEQTLGIAQLTEEDLHFAYENWQMFADLKELASNS